MTAKQDTIIRQDQIARATLELAAQGGLRSVSVAAVARRVGVVPSAIYRHFRNKDEMLDAVMSLVHTRLSANAEAVQGEDIEPLNQLHRLLMLHAQLIRENRGIPQVLLSQDFYVERPHRRQRMYEGIRNYLGQVAGIIRKAQVAGQAAADVDPDVAATMFLGLIQPAAILWHMSNGDFDVTRQARAAWPLFRRALQAPGGPTVGTAPRNQTPRTKGDSR